MPHGSAINCVDKPITPINASAINRELADLRILIVPLQFDFDLYKTLAIINAIADPDMFQTLTVILAFLHREPRSGHKVDPFQSQTGPEMVEPNSFDSSAGHERLEIPGFHLKHVPAIERNE